MDSQRLSGQGNKLLTLPDKFLAPQLAEYTGVSRLVIECQSPIWWKRHNSDGLNSRYSASPLTTYRVVDAPLIKRKGYSSGGLSLE